jgi:hypothetical protein
MCCMCFGAMILMVVLVLAVFAAASGGKETFEKCRDLRACGYNQSGDYWAHVSPGQSRENFSPDAPGACQCAMCVRSVSDGYRSL